MRVLHVAQPTHGGLVSYVVALVGDQVRRGWDVHVACPPTGTTPGLVESAGAIHHAWPATRSPGPSAVSEVVRLRRVIRRVAPDVVHLHSSKAGFSGRLALRSRLPTIFQPHAWSFHAVGGAVRRAAVSWERLGARWAGAVVCVSEAEREQGDRAGIRAPWRVIYNGVDVEALTEVTEDARRAARDRLGLPGVPLAVCVGRLSRQKGQDVLLDGWPAVLDRVPDAELILVGGGEDFETLAARSVPQVRFAGERDDVPDWLAAADLFVVASRWEGMSLAILEAMARGLSIVATDVAGTREQLGAEAGAVVPPEDAPALAAEIARRLADPAVRTEEGRAARARAVRSHDVRRATAEIAALYSELVGEATTNTRVPAA